MRPWLVELVPFTEIKHDLFGILQRVSKIDEMVHEVADCVEYYILGQNLWYAHSLSLFVPFTFAHSSIATIWFITAKQGPFEGFSKIVDIAHKTICKFLVLIGISVAREVLTMFLFVLFFLNGFLKLLV